MLHGRATTHRMEGKAPTVSPQRLTNCTTTAYRSTLETVCRQRPSTVSRPANVPTARTIQHHRLRQHSRGRLFRTNADPNKRTA